MKFFNLKVLSLLISFSIFVTVLPVHASPIQNELPTLISNNANDIEPYGAMSSTHYRTTPYRGSSSDYTTVVSTNVINMNTNQKLSAITIGILSGVITLFFAPAGVAGLSTGIASTIMQNLPNKYQDNNMIYCKTTIYKYKTATPGALYQKQWLPIYFSFLYNTVPI